MHQWTSPPVLFAWIERLLPIVGGFSLLLLLVGLVGGLIMAPPDAVQGEGFRILYIHVPAAILSMNIFVIMAVCAVIGLVWRVKVAFWVMEASAPIGASMTLLTLLTGATDIRAHSFFSVHRCNRAHACIIESKDSASSGCLGSDYRDD
jgi:heme exporter protein C